MAAPDRLARRLRLTALWCGLFAAGMIGLAYAAVPLYDLFCRVTGFDGRPRVATQEATRTGERTIRVRFDGNVAPGLAWRFAPEEPQIALKPGVTRTILYRAESFSREETVGAATFNVYPPTAAPYFNKLQCFCFTDTPLKPGQSVDVPVVFYLDPAFETDPDLRQVDTITLSYTFFATKTPRRTAATVLPPSP
jgi:cytochrome c oxidase assembly protein subunit 11